MKILISNNQGYRIFSLAFNVLYRENCVSDSKECYSRMEDRLLMKNWSPKKNCKIDIIDKKFNKG